jgi:transporter family protein
LLIGIEGIDSNLGTAIRTTVVLFMAWLMVFVTGKQKEIKAAAGVLLITAGTVLLAII